MAILGWRVLEYGDGDGILALRLVPKDIRWLSDNHVLSCAVSDILMVNLLIAMISTTYEQYINFSKSILLMEKYNIMAMHERALAKHEMHTLADKYACVSRTMEWFDLRNMSAAEFNNDDFSNSNQINRRS